MGTRVAILACFVLVLLAGGTEAQAQAAGRFNRVSTAGRPRSPVASPSRATNVARSGAARGLERTSATADPLHPFSNQAMARLQATEPGEPRSTTQAEPERLQPPPSQPQSRTYFPGMRPARAYQQPVTLTARATGMPMHICTPSRSMAMAGGHH